MVLADQPQWLSTHCLPVYAGSDVFPHAEQAAREVLSLPIWPEMRTGQIERVTEAIRACLG